MVISLGSLEAGTDILKLKPTYFMFMVAFEVLNAIQRPERGSRSTGTQKQLCLYVLSATALY